MLPAYGQRIQALRSLSRAVLHTLSWQESPKFPEDSDLSPRKMQEAAAAEGTGPRRAGAMPALSGLLALEPGKRESALGGQVPSACFPVQ